MHDVGFRKRPLNASSAALALACFAQAMPAYAQEQTYSFDIPSQDLGSALRAFARASRSQVTFDDRAVRGKRAPALQGTLTARDALEALLRGSGLAASTGRSGLYIVKPMSGSRAVGSLGEVETGLRDNEIVVTAQKREERARDVPFALNVVQPSNLVNNNSTSMREWAISIPGLNVSPNIGGQTFVSIRGLTTGSATNSTVGFSIDDIPYGGTIVGTGGSTAPDFDPEDLERVEVLKGPQGTLYGANSVGGLIKFVTKDPSPDGFQGRIQAATSIVADSGNPSRSIRASANIPITGTVAVRASAFGKYDAGYIDNLLLAKADWNVNRSFGGRVSALFNPADNLSIKASAQYQKFDGHFDEEYDLDSLQSRQNLYIAGTGDIHREDLILSLIGKLRLNAIEITSITGYSRNDESFNAYYPDRFGDVALIEVADPSKFSQELRASGDIGASLEWSIGGFLTDERRRVHFDLDTPDPATGSPVTPFFDNLAQFHERALFGTLLYRLSDRFDIQVGGRKTWIDQQIGELGADDTAFTYLVATRLKLKRNVMAYGRIATGYRPGGLNNVPARLEGAPDSYSPDRATNYEIGLKASTYDDRFSVDLSGFWIDWDKLQVVARTSGSKSYSVNGGKARSRGVELATTWRPASGTMVSAWATYIDAEVRNDFPVIGIKAFTGDRLPNSPDWSASMSLDQNLPIFGSDNLSFGITGTYVGERIGQFTVPGPREIYPSYTKADVRIKFSRGPWSTNLFVNNVTDSHGVLSGGLGHNPNYAYIHLKPRELGISLTREF